MSARTHCPAHRDVQHPAIRQQPGRADGWWMQLTVERRALGVECWARMGIPVQFSSCAQACSSTRTARRHGTTPLPHLLGFAACVGCLEGLPFVRSSAVVRDRRGKRASACQGSAVESSCQSEVTDTSAALRGVCPDPWGCRSRVCKTSGPLPHLPRAWPLVVLRRMMSSLPRWHDCCGHGCCLGSRASRVEAGAWFRPLEGRLNV